MQKHLNKFYLSVSMILLVLVAACAPSATTAPTTAPSAATSAPSAQRLKVSLMVGGVDKIIYLIPTLAKQLGYYEEQKLDVDVLDEPSGVSAEDAMLAGQVNFTVGFYDHTVDLQSKGKATMSAIILDQVTGEAEMVSSKLADQIKSPADFKGRNLGVTSIGSSTWFLTNYLAVKAGLKVEDIHPVAVSAGNTLIAAIQKGQVDAAMTTEPTISRLIKSGDAKVLLDMRTVEANKAALGGGYPGASLYGQTDWINKNKEVTQRLVNALYKALRYVKNHSAEEIAAKVPADFYAGDKDLYLTALKNSLDMFSPDGTMPADAPQTVLNVQNAFNKSVQGKQINLAATYTDEYVKNAATAVKQ